MVRKVGRGKWGAKSGARKVGSKKVEPRKVGQEKKGEESGAIKVGREMWVRKVGRGY